MTEIKTVKGFLKTLIDIDHTIINELSGAGLLSLDEIQTLSSICADVSNSLGENEEILKKFEVKRYKHE